MGSLHLDLETALDKAIGREKSDPYVELDDKTIRRCVHNMLKNVSKASAEELMEIAQSLRHLLDQQSGSYLSFKFDRNESFEAAKGLLALLLNGYPALYEVTEKSNLKRPYITTNTWSTEDLLDVTSRPDHQYILKLKKVPHHQFPQRAVIWITIALSLASSGINKTSGGLLNKPPEVEALT